MFSRSRGNRERTCFNASSPRNAPPFCIDPSRHPLQKPHVTAGEIEYLLLPSNDVFTHEPPGKLRIVAQDGSKDAHVFPRRNLSVVTHVNRVSGRKHDALRLCAHLRYGSYQQSIVGQSSDAEMESGVSLDERAEFSLTFGAEAGG